MLEIIVWILLISSFTIFGSWYAQKYNRPDALIGLYVAFVIFSNIAAVKIGAFNLYFDTFFAPAAVLIFSLTFLLTDIVNEKFGRHETHRMILIAFMAQVATTLFAWLVVRLQPAPFWHNQENIEMLFGQVPRIVLASWTSFLVCENLDAWIFDWFKKLTNGKHVWMRNAFSSLPAMALDSVLFISIAFGGGAQPIMPLILGLLTVKWLVGIINVPFMYLNRWVLYRS